MTREEYKFKKIEKQDIEQAVFIVRSSFNAEYLSSSIYRGKGICKFIENEIDNPFSPYNYLGLYKENTLIGFSEYKLFKSNKTSFLNIIAIDNEYKNEGIGSVLFENATNLYRAEGYESIELDVFASNTNAINWYLKLGFKNENTTSFFKINLTESVNHISFDVLNYPQFKIVNNSYGFYFLDLQFANQRTSIGVIDDDLIIRGSKEKKMEAIAFLLKKKLMFNNVYFIGNNCPFDLFVKKDEILRMLLKI